MCCDLKTECLHQLRAHDRLTVGCSCGFVILNILGSAFIRALAMRLPATALPSRTSRSSTTSPSSFTPASRSALSRRLAMWNQLLLGDRANNGNHAWM
mmetsp:Transcript_13974/g.43053  ORF Transcript_13974/g.43053 Transcript_13974/m.43053 type:complete len:98 (+) Transcript_13974:205-498(+)